jgi:hypothetical protein
VPTRRRKQGRPTARAASTLGDCKAMDLASDEEELIEPKVFSVPWYHIGKHVLICDATDLLGANLCTTPRQAFGQARQQGGGQAGSGGILLAAGSGVIFPAGEYTPPSPPSLTLTSTLPPSLPPSPPSHPSLSPLPLPTHPPLPPPPLMSPRLHVSSRDFLVHWREY